MEIKQKEKERERERKRKYKKKERKRGKRKREIKHLAMEFKSLRTTGVLAFDSDV